MRVAVVGGGAFGCASAVALAEAGHSVDLFERGPELLGGSSFANCGRLHLGYHYPRSEATGRAAQLDAVAFADRYPETVIDDEVHHYAVALHDSKVSPVGFAAFCDRMGLAYELSDEAVNDAVAFRVPEQRIDLRVLASRLRAELERQTVEVHLDSQPTVDDLVGRYAVVVDASYGQWRSGRPMQYEVCELVLVSLPSAWVKQSWVVIDGEFVSLDPWSLPGFWSLYAVDGSVHSRNVGVAPVIPEHLRPWVNSGPIRDWSLTHFPAMADVVSRFFRLKAERSMSYSYSLFTVRAVLPEMEETDARPTIVSRDGQLVTVLSGKLSAIVRASEDVVRYASEAA